MSTATPSLSRRVILVGVAVVALVLVTVNIGVYIALRTTLYSTLDDVLAERAATVLSEQRSAPTAGAEELARRLQSRGLRAVIRDADGAVFRSDPSSPVLSGQLPPTADEDSFTSRSVPLPDGASAEVFARTSGVTSTLTKLVAIQLVVSLLALVTATALLSQAARIALRPVGAIAASAARTTAGRRGERLRPDRPDTELGRMATAYDEMLDALEAGDRRSADLEQRTGALEARWRQVIEAANEAYVVVDAEGLIQDWNRQAEVLLGWTRDEVVGRPAALIVTGSSQPAIVQWIAQAVEAGAAAATEPYELALQTKDDRTIASECRVWGVDRRGERLVHAFLRDVSQRREAEQMAARLAAVVEGSSDAILTQDLDGTIRTWNAAAERGYGWPAADAVGQSMALVLADEELRMLTDRLARLARGEQVSAYEGERRTRGGTTIPVSVRLSPLYDGSGAVVAASSIERDLTEQRFLAGTLDTTLAALEQALNEATAAEARTRQFLADAAHQLRTPMAGIRGCAETLLRGVPAETGEQLLALMVRETARAARLITALLQMARLDQGDALVLQPCDVVAICADEVERAQLLSPQLAITLDSTGAVRRPPLDEDGVAEILGNLIDNARRHAQSSVGVTVVFDAQEVRLTVRDDGAGLAPEQAEQVFERFVSLDAGGGSGLGLPIARGFARAMGGDIVYDDGFVVSFPTDPD